MAGKARAAHAARSKLLSQAMLRLRNNRRARLQCCAAFTIAAAAMWLTRRLWRDRVSGLLATEQVRVVSRRCPRSHAHSLATMSQCDDTLALVAQHLLPFILSGTSPTCCHQSLHEIASVNATPQPAPHLLLHPCAQATVRA